LSQELSDLTDGGYLIVVNSQTDQQLLREYLASGTEAAFSEFVRDEGFVDLLSISPASTASRI
jgi:hypothetical protein